MSRQDQIDQIITDLTRRANAGERIDRQAIERRNGQLMPELGFALDRYHASHSAPDPARFSLLTVEGPAGHGMMAPDGLASPRIEGYEILGLLGHGGMGQVYKARQLAAGGRLVALKVLPGQEYASPAQRRRFQREIEIASTLHHPNIADLYDSGLIRGVYYFAMELIDGQPLDAFCRRRDLTLQAILELFQKVCSAMAFAHEHGVVHRDLKPSNILVDARGEPHILDFGLAKTLDAGAVPVTLQTEPGQIMGTLNYMSPEQAGGVTGHVDARSDVYSLGVVGFELLTGRLPYDVSGRSVHDALRIICEEEPPKLAATNRTLRGDLDTIFAKALEKDPQRRYPTATELGADLRRYLDYEPILARPAGALYRMGKFARRNRVLVSGVAAVIAMLVLGVAGTTAGLVNARRQQALAQAAAEHARTSAADARREAEARRQSNYVLNIGLAQSQALTGNTALAEKALADCPEDLRDWEWHYLSATIDQAARVVDVSWPQAAVCWSPDGARLAAAGQGSSAAIYDSESGRVVARLEGHLSTDPVYHIRFLQDGRRLVTAGADATLRIWDAESGREIDRFQTEKRFNPVMDLSSDGRRVAYQSNPVDQTTPLRVIDMDSKRATNVTSGPKRVIALAWRPNAEHLGTIDADGVLALIDLTTDRTIWTEMAGRSRSVSTVLSFDSTGKWMIFQSTGRSLIIRSTDSMAERIRVAGFDDVLHHAAFSPSGEMIAAGGVDRFIYLIHAHTGEIMGKLRGHQAMIWQLAWSPDGRRLASASIDGSIRIWNVEAPAGVNALMTSPDEVASLACDAKGTRLLAATRDSGLRVLDLVGQKGLHTIPADKPIHQACLSADGQVAAAITNAGVITTWRLSDSPQAMARIAGVAADLSTVSMGIRSCLALSRDGRRVYGGTPRQVSACDTATGVVVGSYPLSAPEEDVWSLAVNTEGSRLAVAQATRVTMFDTASGKTVWVAKWRHEKPVGAALPASTFSPDGRILAVGSRDSSVRLFEVATGELVRQFSEVAAQGQHRGGAINRIDSLVWSDDGQRIFTSSTDNLIKVWDPLRGALLLALPGHTGRIYAMAFSPLDQRLFTGSVDRRLAAWDPRPRQAVIHLAPSPAPPPWNSANTGVPATLPATEPAIRTAPAPMSSTQTPASVPPR